MKIFCHDAYVAVVVHVIDSGSRPDQGALRCAFGRADRWWAQSNASGLGMSCGFPPGEKHWHGATPTTAMTHIAVQEFLNGRNVDWMGKVSDAQYGK